MLFRSEILTKEFQPDLTPRVGAVRSIWKEKYHFDVSALVHHIVFRITCNYLDQGIALWPFPSKEKGLLNAARDLDKLAVVSLFRTKKGREIFHDNSLGIKDLLKLIVGDPEDLYSSYLFDLCFAHPGWSGMVATIEQLPV